SREGDEGFLGGAERGGMGFRDGHRSPPRWGQVFGRVSPRDPVAILLESDIQLPMQTVLDAPMVAQAPAVVLRARPLAADEIPGLGGRLAAYRPLAITDADGGQTGPVLTPANPLGAVQDGVTTIL